MFLHVAAATASEPSQAPALARVTTVAGQGAGYVPIHVPTAIQANRGGIDRPTGPPGVTISVTGGGPRFLAAELRSRKQVGGLFPAVMGLRSTRDPSGTYTFGNLNRLPAGDYRLYVHTDQPEPYRVTIKVPELAGESHLQPIAALPIHAGAGQPRPSTTVPATTLIETGQERHALGFLFVEFSVRYADPSTPARGEFCQYARATRSSSVPEDHSVGCPGGRIEAEFPRDNPSWTSGAGFQAMFFNLFTGYTSFGGNFSNPGQPNLALYMAYIPYPEDDHVALAPVGDTSHRVQSGWVVIARRSLKVVRRKAHLPLRCMQAVACEGTVGLGRPRGKAVRFSIPPQATRWVRVPIPPHLSKSLRRRRPVRASLFISGFDAAGVSRHQASKVRLR